MARPPRLDVIFERYADPVWFLTLNTLSRQRWLDHADVHSALENFAVRGRDAGRAYLGRYVLMPDHLPLFVQLSRDEVLGEWVKALKAILVRASDGQTGRWQKGFFDHLLRHSESYREKWESVRMNPVRAGLVQRPEDWLYQGECCPLRLE